MKREFLQSLKVGEQELPKEIIDAIMTENGKDIETTKKSFADYDDVKKQLGEANKAIEGFKALDVDGIKKAADEWKQKAEQAEKDAADKIAAAKFDGALDSALAKSGAKNAKALKALLDLEKVKLDGETLTGLDEQIEAVKKEADYLFNAPGAWGGRQGGSGGNLSGVEEAFYAKNPDLRPKE